MSSKEKIDNFRVGQKYNWRELGPETIGWPVWLIMADKTKMTPDIKVQVTKVDTHNKIVYMKSVN